jgi:ubiquinone/menaquinone biosynthesis C-methylase UbiE/DNA-binding MarR family transcriptional regulator
MAEALTSGQLVEVLKAVGETTRLRLLTLLAQGEYNVKDLTQILGQSQPRLSRHLKLLAEAGLVERFQEGSSVFFRISEISAAANLTAHLFAALNADDAQMQRDFSRADALKREKSDAAQTYFQAHAAAWNDIRALHAPEAEVEAAMLRAIGPKAIGFLVDLGTGTGRILELFAERATRAVGFDVNRDMLAHARARLAAAGVRNTQLRLGDIFTLTLEDGVADVVVLHQVLHFLDDPAKTVTEAARLLKPGGRLMIVDFAAHCIEALRTDYAHRRLGFERASVEGWLMRSGLRSVHFEAIAPKDGSANKLTVSLWLGAKPTGAINRKSKSAEHYSEG